MLPNWVRLPRYKSKSFPNLKKPKTSKRISITPNKSDNIIQFISLTIMSRHPFPCNSILLLTHNPTSPNSIYCPTHNSFAVAQFFRIQLPDFFKQSNILPPPTPHTLPLPQTHTHTTHQHSGDNSIQTGVSIKC